MRSQNLEEKNLKFIVGGLEFCIKCLEGHGSSSAERELSISKTFRGKWSVLGADQRLTIVCPESPRASVSITYEDRPLGDPRRDKGVLKWGLR